MSTEDRIIKSVINIIVGVLMFFSAIFGGIVWFMIDKFFSL